MLRLAWAALLSFHLLPSLSAQVPDGLREALQDKFRESQLEPLGQNWIAHSPRTILVVQREGLGWNRDRYHGRQLSPHPAEIDIRKGRIRAERRVENLFRAGELLVPYEVKIRADRIELNCRAIAYYPVWRGRIRGDNRNFVRSEFVSTRLRFFFEKATIREGELGKILEAIEIWVKPFEDFEGALSDSNEVNPDDFRALFIGMSQQDLSRFFGSPREIVRSDTYVGRRRDWKTVVYGNFEVTFQDDRVVSYHEFRRQP